MSRTTMTAAFAAILAASPMAFAQMTASNAATTVTTNRIVPGQLRATDMKGSSVYDAQNNKVGDIKDMVFDRDGRVAAVVIDVDGKNVAVGMDDLHITMNDNDKPKTITVNKSRDELKSATAYQLDTTGPNSGSSSMPPTERNR